MMLPNLSYKALPLWVTAIASILSLNTSAQADDRGPIPTYPPAVINYSTTLPAGYPAPYLMPYGYNETKRSMPQIIMAGVSPSIIDLNDTEFDILALVRPGTKPLQKVAFAQGGDTKTLFNFSLLSTLKNGDQFWKITYKFNAGAYGYSTIPVKWGQAAGINQYFVQATDAGQAFIQPNNDLTAFTGNPFPSVKFGNYPYLNIASDTRVNDTLRYNSTKRAAAQAIMAGVSPAVVDVHDSSFDVIALLRPGIVPIQQVTLKQGHSHFGLGLEKRKILSNGDEIWATTYKFRAGTYGVQTIPIVWGTNTNEYYLEATDAAYATAIVYPNLRAGNFPAH